MVQPIKIFFFPAFIAVAVVIVAISSVIGLRLIQEKLSYLTEQSTPYQIGTLELQNVKINE